MDESVGLLSFNSTESQVRILLWPSGEFGEVGERREEGRGEMERKGEGGGGTEHRDDPMAREVSLERVWIRWGMV